MNDFLPPLIALQGRHASANIMLSHALEHGIRAF